jgi:hypothetical protein
VSDEPPDLPSPTNSRVERWGRSRLPFDPEASPFKGAPGGGQVIVFAIAAVALAGLALYMGFVLHHPLTSAYVMAPSVGAAWFVMRLVLKLSSRN